MHLSPLVGGAGLMEKVAKFSSPREGRTAADALTGRRKNGGQELSNCENENIKYSLSLSPDMHLCMKKETSWKAPFVSNWLMYQAP